MTGTALEGILEALEQAGTLEALQDVSVDLRDRMGEPELASADRVWRAGAAVRRPIR